MTILPTEHDVACDVALERAELLRHPVFAAVSTKEDLRVFMETHVFAVWDFMSLVKRLQLDFTCVRLPWTPPAWRLASRLINDIVTGEESDHGPDGAPLSHYELYLAAMEEVGADTGPIRRFVAAVASGDTDAALADMEAPDHVRRFVAHTLDTACVGSTAQVVGAFFYGREDVIPEIFKGLLDDWGVDPAGVPQLVYYLERHIELDADEHGPAARLIVDEMLRADPQLREHVTDAARAALRQRIELWDGVHQSLLAAQAARSSTAWAETFPVVPDSVIEVRRRPSGEERVETPTIRIDLGPILDGWDDARAATLIVTIDRGR